MNMLTALNLANDSAAITLSLVGLLMMHWVGGMEKRLRNFYRLTFSLLLFSGFLQLAATLCTVYLPDLLSGGFSLVTSALSTSLLMPVYVWYLLFCCGEERRGNPFFIAACVLDVLTFLVTLIGADRKRLQIPIPGSPFSFDAVYASVILVSAAYLAFLLIGILRRRKKLTRGQVLLFLVCVLASSLLETVFFAVFLLKDQADRYLAQKEEAARERARAAVLEMRPHFILNTMTSIYYLCGQDPGRARQVILDFTSYLRDNFTALARDDTVPFTDELEHARAYLAVEQVRFENRLFVEFDTPATQFRLPPLTLQPIVENAVKYGINPEAAPLLIRVVSRETAEGFEVTVSDNGPGFDERDFLRPDDREPHVALNNIRERLTMMCSGTLSVERREEGGSAVTIRIPGR